MKNEFEPTVDMRSDTVTKPSDAMRDAMRRAVVGNASWGEDPTVNELERRSAEAVGKDAALFMPSGTMGNIAALRAWTARVVAPEIVCEAKAHLYLNEAAGIATVAHAQVRALAGVRGALQAADVERAIQPVGSLKPQTALVALENTHNYASGAVIPLAAQAAVAKVARAHKIPLHLDGARIFNAAVALGVPARAVAEAADSVQFCFSKGLGAPVGSVLCGPREFVADARKVRQYLGGAMRQAGIVAAGALMALDEGPKRLADDHRRAKRLAAGLAGAPGLRFETPDTNILVVDVGADAGAFAAEVRKHDVGISVVSPTEVRACTHLDVDDAGIERAIEAIRGVAERR
ncbi:MAG: threonine aldolase family protein [Thermoplasmatota archaeon]